MLDDTHIAAAEKMIPGDLPGKTPGQIARLAALAVDTVDPEGARKRREHAEREDARVRFWREHTGASAMTTYGLPTDAALSANANISQRAEQYKKARIYPDARMDQLRVLALADILNGVSAAARVAQAQAEAQAGPGTGISADTLADPDDGDSGCDNDGPGDDPGSDGHSGRSGGSAEAAPDVGDVGPVLPAKSNLTLPLATLLRLAERPGLGHGLGALDPALVRGLAAAARTANGASPSPTTTATPSATDARNPLGSSEEHSPRSITGTVRGPSPGRTIPARQVSSAPGFSPSQTGGSLPLSSARFR